MAAVYTDVQGGGCAAVYTDVRGGGCGPRVCSACFCFRALLPCLLS